MSAVIVARLLPKAARGERDRVCHLIPVPDDDQFPDALKALCGVEIRQGEAEMLPGPQGMPCFTCLASSRPDPTCLPRARGPEHSDPRMLRLGRARSF